MPDKCTCDIEAIEDHPCPYKEDVLNECYLDFKDKTLCNCCDYCTKQCSDDI